ncbi:MAG: FeoB-associated Cys-rich membrane protein [Bergeyella zoohelcum]|nr:FeoB-associated Cys-rich membrane protein [Bergeyella zoohelcum]
MDSSIIQWIIIAVLAVGAVFYLFNKFTKTFSKKKKNSSCDTNCGCS